MLHNDPMASLTRLLTLACFLHATAVPALLCQSASPAQRSERPVPPTRDPHTPGYVAAKELADGELPPPDADGNFIRAFGKNGDGPGYFARPKGIAIDSDGHVWVADAMQDRVSRMLEEAFGGYRGRGPTWHPDLDIDENEDGWVIEARLPGVSTATAFTRYGYSGKNAMLFAS